MISAILHDMLAIRIVFLSDSGRVRCHNRPFDIYAAIFPWPPEEEEKTRPAWQRLCFLAGWAVLRENEHYVGALSRSIGLCLVQNEVQWLNAGDLSRVSRSASGQKGRLTPGNGQLLRQNDVK